MGLRPRDHSGLARARRRCEPSCHKTPPTPPSQGGDIQGGPPLSHPPLTKGGRGGSLRSPARRRIMKVELFSPTVTVRQAGRPDRSDRQESEDGGGNPAKRGSCHGPYGSTPADGRRFWEGCWRCRRSMLRPRVSSRPPRLRPTPRPRPPPRAISPTLCKQVPDPLPNTAAPTHARGVGARVPEDATPAAGPARLIVPGPSRSRSAAAEPGTLLRGGPDPRHAPAGAESPVGSPTSRSA